MTGNIRSLAAAIAVLGGTACAFGEAKIVSKAIEGMARNWLVKMKINMSKFYSIW